MMSEQKYMTNGELRARICIQSDIETTRYGPGSDRALRKHHLLEIADRLGMDTGGMDLAELYLHLCAHLGVDYPENAGCQWALDRAVLKALHEALSGDDG